MRHLTPPAAHASTTLIVPEPDDHERMLDHLDEAVCEVLSPEAGHDRPCVVVVPPSPPNFDGRRWEPPLERMPPALRVRLKIVAAHNLSPQAVRIQLGRPGPKLLIGTAALLSQLDLVGLHVPLLVLGRLPFVSHSHPLQAAVAARMGVNVAARSGFGLYSLPESIAATQRLIDMTVGGSTAPGAAVLLDDRLTLKQYGRTYLETLEAGSIVRVPAAFADAVREALEPGARVSETDASEWQPSLW